MAKNLQQGAGAITVWMIVFVALWLVSTVFLVILYTGQEELTLENKRITEYNRKLINEREKNSLSIVSSARPEGPTVVGLLEQARAQTALLASGNESDDVATVRTGRDDLAGVIEQDGIVDKPGRFQDASLLKGMQMLYGAFKSSHQLRLAAEERLEELETEVGRLVSLTTEQKDSFDAMEKEAQDQLISAEQSHSKYRTERDASVERISKEFDEHLSQNDEVLTTAREHAQELEQHNEGLLARLRAQQEKFGELMIGPEQLSTARKPDGRILTAYPGDSIVFADLGSNDRVTLGLVFSVYAANKGIPSSGRAKAQIEVVSMTEEASECLKKWVAPGEVILEGDLIANPVFDKDRPLSFVTTGGFDLDRNGETDSDGTKTVEAMIGKWGGVVSSQLTALTDFVIVGKKPRRPRNADQGSAEQQQRAARLIAEIDRYERTVNTANSLGIPVLPQDVFLKFLGFAR